MSSGSSSGDRAERSHLDSLLLSSPGCSRHHQIPVEPEPISPLPPASRSAHVGWVVLALLAVQASFGGNAVIVKVALSKSADPVIFSFLRDVGGAAVLLLACQVRGCLVWPRRADLGHFVLLGVLGVYIGQMFLVIALQYVEPLLAAVMQPLQPILTVVLAAFTGVEPLHLEKVHGRMKVGGVLLAAAGAIVTVYYAAATGAGDALHRELSAARRHESYATATSEGDANAPRIVLGTCLLATQSVSGALYQLLQKHLLSSSEHDYPPLTVAAMGYVIGAVCVGLVLPVCKLEAESWAFLSDGVALAALAYAVLMTSAFNYALQAFANKNSSPTLVTAFFPLQIVFTALFAWMALGTAPRSADCLGAVMIVGGLGAVTGGRVLHAKAASKRRAGLDV